MKSIFIILGFVIFISPLTKCKTVSKKKVNENNVEENLIDYALKRFDLDSTLTIKIPNQWDSIGYLKFPSYEYKYYIELRPRTNLNERILVKRLRFNIPTVDLDELSHYYKNEMTTIPDYKNIHLQKDSLYLLKDKKAGDLLYSFLFKEKRIYESRTFLVNADSSITVIEIKTHDIDTSVSYKRILSILNSIEIIK